MLDPCIVTLGVRKFLIVAFDYFGEVCAPCFPDGLDVGVLHGVALKYAYSNAMLKFEREHVARHFGSQGKFKCMKVVNSRGLSISQ